MIYDIAPLSCGRASSEYEVKNTGVGAFASCKIRDEGITKSLKHSVSNVARPQGGTHMRAVRCQLTRIDKGKETVVHVDCRVSEE